METKNKPIKIIFSIRVAAELQRLGNPLIERIPNIHKPEFDVFIFHDTRKLQEDMTEIMKGRRDK